MLSSSANQILDSWECFGRPSGLGRGASSWQSGPHVMSHTAVVIVVVVDRNPPSMAALSLPMCRWMEQHTDTK